MKTKILLVLALVLTASNLTLWGGAKYVKTWKNPEAQPGVWKGKKVLAFAKTRVTAARQGAEEALVRELGKLGIEGVSGLSLIPAEAEKDRELARRLLSEAGIAGAVIMQVVDVKDETDFTTGQTPYGSFNSNTTLWGTSWDSGWSAAGYGPGSMVTSQILVVETRVFAVDQDRLLWGGIRETPNPKAVGQVMQPLVGATAKQIKKAGLAGR